MENALNAVSDPTVVKLKGVSVRFAMLVCVPAAACGFLFGATTEVEISLAQGTMVEAETRDQLQKLLVKYVCRTGYGLARS